MNEGPMVLSGSEEHQRFGVSWAISTGVGAEPRLPRSLFCREGSFPRRQQSSVLVVGRKGKRECSRALPRPRERRPLVGLSPSGARGEWCEVWCLLCQGKTAKRVGPVWPQNCLLQPSGLLFPPFFKCLHMCGRTNTDADTIN